MLDLRSTLGWPVSSGWGGAAPRGGRRRVAGAGRTHAALLNLTNSPLQLVSHALASQARPARARTL